MKFKNPFRNGEKRNTANPAGLFSAAWDVLTNTHDTSSGQPINESIALQHLSVYACTRVIAESVGSMTIRLYKKLPKGRQEAFENPIHRMLSVSPNSEMSAPVMWECVAGSMALCGHSFVEVLRNKQGAAVGLYPLDSRMTKPVRLPNGLLAYKTTVGVGADTGESRIIAAVDMLSFPLFSLDGLVGLSPIQQARNSIGLAIAAEKYGGKFFGNNSVPPAYLTPVGDVDEKDLANMREFWERANSATSQGRTAVLPSDWKLTQLAMSPEDSQFLQTRQFSRTDIAGLFRVPPSYIGDTTGNAKANHEQQSLDFVTNTLRPYLVRIEKEIQRRLLPEDGSMFAEFDVSERLRGDFATTMQGFAIGKQWGFYNTNTVLEKLGENPVGPEGDVYWAPFNMTNAANLLPGAKQAPVQSPMEDAPTEAQRSMFDSYIPTFAGLFQDAIGRVTTRSKRDAENLSPIMYPVLEAISQIVVSEARSQFHLPDLWNPSEKIVKDCIKSISTRAQDWTVETKAATTSIELNKALRSIHLNIFREAGAAVALTDPPKLRNPNDE